MADILQAAKWMQEGKKVRQLGWDADVASWAVDQDTGHCHIVVAGNGCVPLLETIDLLADDWEVA